MVKTSGQKVQSVQRALRLMECFTLDHPDRSLGELAQQSGLSKSTVFRLLSTLAESGYIRQDSLTQKYSLGFKLFHLGSVVVSQMTLRNTALPYMEELCEETSETVDLNIVEGHHRVCIERVESSNQVRNFVRIGHRNHLWLGASGRVLLAHLEEKKRQQLLSNAWKTGKLQLDETGLEQKLKGIRKAGYAITVSERIEGAFAISAPIFNHTGQLVGGIAAAGPVQRLTEEWTPFLIKRVVHTAREISETMGFTQ